MADGPPWPEVPPHPQRYKYARQCPALTVQLSRQTRQNLGERLCNPAAHQPLSQHQRLIPDTPIRFLSPVSSQHRLDRATPQANGPIDQCQRRFLLGLLGKFSRQNWLCY
jgi:hypothetical protein